LEKARGVKNTKANNVRWGHWTNEGVHQASDTGD
jgi:hypothetical protein